jgi:hypothetical protein
VYAVCDQVHIQFVGIPSAIQRKTFFYFYCYSYRYGDVGILSIKYTMEESLILMEASSMMASGLSFVLLLTEDSPD